MQLRLRELRNKHKLTQQEVADILKIDRGNYSKYESGKLEVNNNMIVTLALFYDVTADFILGLAKK